MTTQSPDTTGVDDQALALRGQGQGFAAIAKTLKLTRPMEANAAFNRALRRRPASEQARIRSQENRRLDRMIAQVRADEKITDERAGKQLRAIERIRTLLMED